MTLFLCSFLYAGFIFLLQRILFSRTCNKAIQCIPLYGIGLVYMVSIGCFLYDSIGFSDHDGFLYLTLLGWILIGINSVALLADGIACLIEKV